MGAPRLTNGLGSAFTTGRWGSFWDVTATQTIPSNNATITLAIGQADPGNNGVSITAGNRVTFAYAGIYSVTWSVQFANTSSTLYDAQLWLRKNGTTSAADVAVSNSRFSITSRHGSTNGHVLGTVNFILSMNAGDYISLLFSAEDTSVFVETLAATTGTPTVPQTPGIILTAVQV